MRFVRVTTQATRQSRKRMATRSSRKKMTISRTAGAKTAGATRRSSQSR